MKKTSALVLAAIVSVSFGFAQKLTSLDPDAESDRIGWSDLRARFGRFKDPVTGTKVCAVAKTLTNEYWRLLGDGYRAFAERYGVAVLYQAAQNEGDQLGQLAIAETLITQGCTALLFSPQTDINLQPAFETARKAGIPVLNVNDAVIPQASHYVGSVQKENGVRAANWMIRHYPDGGKVAVIEGPPDVYAACQRTAGFSETITAAGNFEIVSSVPANWSREQAFNRAATILQQYPDLKGFYANNDGMALGVVEAVKAAGKLGVVAVIGTDGISEAYKSIKAGELTATIDSFPVLTGEIAMEVILRILNGDELPRVVVTPQALITADNIDRFSVTGDALRKAIRNP